MWMCMAAITHMLMMEMMVDDYQSGGVDVGVDAGVTARDIVVDPAVVGYVNVDG